MAPLSKVNSKYLIFLGSANFLEAINYCSDPFW